MKMETELCLAAGFDVARMQPMDVFLLAGKIVADPLFAKYRAAGGSAETLTPALRANLRERISGVVQLPKQA
jgi:hypothetical protein